MAKAATDEVAAAAAVAATHEWFERNSGWAPPDTVTLAEWMAERVCRCPDECLVQPEACCEHGLASWWLLLRSLRRGLPADRWDPTLMIPHPTRLDLTLPRSLAIVVAHEHASEAGEPCYQDPATGLSAMTARSLWKRGYCCSSGCRHCPYIDLDPAERPTAGRPISRRL